MHRLLPLFSFVMLLMAGACTRRAIEPLAGQTSAYQPLPALTPSPPVPAQPVPRPLAMTSAPTALATPAPEQANYDVYERAYQELGN